MKEIKRNKKAELKMTKSKKKSRFDLDGEDLQNYKLTHKGMEVEKMDDFEEAGLASDEELEAEYVENVHFDGFEGEGEEKEQSKYKTKKQVYEEIIAKSKLFK